MPELFAVSSRAIQPMHLSKTGTPRVYVYRNQDVNAAVRKSCRCSIPMQLVSMEYELRLDESLQPITGVIWDTDLQWAGGEDGWEYTLYQIFEHLLQNSAKAGATRIVVSTARQGNKIILELADNGHGISRDKLPYLFKKQPLGYDFDQNANNPDIKTTIFMYVGGTGWGLSWVLSYVETIDGQIELVRNVPQNEASEAVESGVTWRISIPCHPQI